MKKILVIEDDPQICDVIKIYFENEGTHTYFINDGKAALDLIDGGTNEFSLVLLDIMLPHADGFSICKKNTQELRYTDNFHYRKRTRRGYSLRL